MTETPRPETRRRFGARFLRAGYPYFLLSPSLLVLLLVGVYPFVFMIVPWRPSPTDRSTCRSRNIWWPDWSII